MSFTKFGAEIWRDFTTAGNPATPAWNVVKADMRAWMLAVEEQVGAGGTFLTSAWSASSVAYETNEVIWHNGVDYICIADHTSASGTEPGIGVDWEDVWEVFAAELSPTGSAALPGMGFGADPDTGFYRLAANVLGITAGGTGRLRVDSSALAPVSNDGLALGTSSLGFSDLHLATGALLNFANGNVTVTHSSGNLAFSGAITLGTDLAVTEGGTGASTPANARTNLGLVIGTDVQAWDAMLDALAGLTSAQGDLIYATGANALAVLNKNTSATRYLSNTGASNNPAWAQIDLSNGVTGDLPFANLTQIAAQSVLGVAGGSTADVAAITAAGNDTVLRRTSDTLSFGQLTVGMIPNDLVTYAKIQNVSASDRLLGRVSSGAGDIEEIEITDFVQGLLNDTDASTFRTSIGLAIGTDVQAYDADLAALAGISSDGILARTGAGTAAARTITGTAGLITVTNGGGVAGNPTLTIADAAAWSLLMRNAGTTGAPAFAAVGDLTEEGSPGTGDFVLGFLASGEIRKFDVGNLPGGGGGGGNLVSDTSPQLGGDLDTNGFDIIVKHGDVIRSGNSDTNALAIGAWDVDGAAFKAFLTLTSANTPTADLDAAVTKAGNAILTGGKHTIWIPANAMLPRFSSPPAYATLDSGAADLAYPTWAFDQTSAEYVCFQIAMPLSWDEGTVTFIPYWTATGGSAAQTCIFTLAGAAISDDDVLNATVGTAQSSSDALIATGDLHIGPESSAITIGGTPAAGDLVSFQLARDISDTLASDALLIGIKVLYTVNAANDA